MNPQQPPSPPQALDPKQQVAQQLKGATNVLVTVSANPSVDQLSAAIGMTLVLNKLGKHATAVFSGEVPSTIEFLQPEKTLEKTTDSLRDFIIALDKAKADKLRYKVEDKFVKIFITPYHTTLTDKDLEFSQGDYNVDVVLALGVKKHDDLDQTIMAHGRILHDATVVSINLQAGADIGAINLTVSDAGSLSEVMVGVSDFLVEASKPLYDQQIATAFLTGIVAATDRFSNQKTTPGTMSIAAKLMNAGANQQLIATKLEEPKPIPVEPPPAIPKKTPDKSPPIAPAVKPLAPKPPTDGSLKIAHESNPAFEMPEGDEDSQENIDKIHIDNEGTLKRIAELEAEKRASEEAGGAPDSRKVVDTPPKLGSRLTANTEPEHLDPSSDALSLPPAKSPILDHRAPYKMPVVPAPNNGESAKKEDNGRLADLEKSLTNGQDNKQIANVKEGGSLDGHYPKNLVKNPDELPPDQTAGDSGGGTAPPIPPPITSFGSEDEGQNLSNPNSGIPL